MSEATEAKKIDYAAVAHTLELLTTRFAGLMELTGVAKEIGNMDATIAQRTARCIELDDEISTADQILDEIKVKTEAAESRAAQLIAEANEKAAQIVARANDEAAAKTTLAGVQASAIVAEARADAALISNRMNEAREKNALQSSKAADDLVSLQNQVTDKANQLGELTAQLAAIRAKLGA